MATTQIISIPVDDSEFQGFKAAWEDWQAHVKNLPADWQKVNAKVSELAAIQRAAGASGVEAWSKSLRLVSQYEQALRDAAKTQDALGKSTVGASVSMHKMASEAKSFAGHIKSAFGHLAKFGAFMAGGSLLGLGGLTFGLDKLANNVLSRSREARGFGITPGQLASFKIHTERVLTNPGAVLQGAVEAQTNPGLLGHLSTLGISATKAENESATALAGQEMLAIHRAFAANPHGFLLSAQSIAAQDQGFSKSEQEVIGRTPTKTLRSDIAASARDASALGFSSQVARDWSNFSIQLHKAGVLIESAFIRSLEPLVRSNALPKLSQDIAGLITSLSNSGQVKRWVGDLATGIQSFAKLLASPSFEKQVATIAVEVASVADSLGELIKGLAHAVEWFTENDKTPKPLKPGEKAPPGYHPFDGKAFPNQKKPPPNISLPNPNELNQIPGWKKVTPKNAEFFPGMAGTRLIPATFETTTPALPAQTIFQGGRGASAFSLSSSEMVKNEAVSRMAGIPPGLLSAVEQTESGGNARAVSSAGAEGAFQFMPATAASFGINPFNPTQERGAAATMLARLIQRYNGNIPEALAAYNWGSGNLDNDLSAHGSDWWRFLPTETSNYIMDVGRRTAALDRGGSSAREQATEAYARERATPRGASSEHPGAAAQTTPQSKTETVADMRERWWRQHRSLQMRIDNRAGADIHIGANAAAAL